MVNKLQFLVNLTALRRGANHMTSNYTMESPPGPPMTLGNAAAARVRVIVWRKSCGHQVEPDAAEIAERYGAGTAVPEWREPLVCFRCGSCNVDMVVTGTERR